VDPSFFPVVSGDGVYVVNEEINAAYLQGNFQRQMNEMRTQGNIGVRVVETKSNGVGGLSIVDTPDEDVIVSNFSALNQSYTEVLPSFNMTFAPDNPNAGWLVRTAISKVLTRPTVGEMNPNWEVNYADQELERGNPTLNPFPGTFENTVNVVAFYEKEGFSTRVAYNFRDDYLIVHNGASNGLNHNEFVEGSGRVDIGVRYRWENGFKISLDLINVTEEQRYIYFDVTDRMEDYTNEGMTTNLSFGYKF
jgi:hypothetical protein